MIFSLLLIFTAIISSSWNFLQAFYYMRKAKNSINEPYSSEKKKFSIIVAEKNEDEKTIRGLIYNLLNLEYDNYEIIIVSDDSPENFKKKYEKYFGLPRLKLINRTDSRGGKAGALNFALNFVSFDYLVFLDSDARVNKDFLNKLSKYNYDIITYRIKIYNSLTNIQKYYKEFTDKVMDSLFRVRYSLGLPIFPNGSALSMKKRVLENLGGWKENTITEDLELGIRAFLKGYKVKYVDDIIVYSQAPFDLNDLFKQIERWSYGSAQLLLYSLKMIKKGIKGIEGFFYTQQWGIYSLFFITLILLASLNFILRIPDKIFIVSIIIYSISLIIYSLIYKEKVNDIKIPLTILDASINGYLKGLLKIPYKWKITPKIKKNTDTYDHINVFLPLLLLLSFIDVIFGYYLSALIIFLYSIIES